MGGTKIESAIFKVESNDTGNVPQLQKLSSRRIPTEKNNKYEIIIENIINSTHKTINEAGVHKTDISCVGFSLNGSICPSTGVFLNGGTPSFVGKKLGEDILTALSLQVPCALGNDANCFALAETAVGAAKDHFQNGSVLGVILGTGLGGGLVLNGNIITGARGAGFEVGHIPFTFENRDCYCGAKGCAETVISGQGLEKTYTLLSLQKATGEEIIELYHRNDVHAVKAVEHFRKNLSYFLAQTTNLLDPDAFVFGGGLSNVSALFEGVEESMKEHLFVKQNSPHLLFNQLGDSSGILGAAYLAIDQKEAESH